jgi:hypothetical protein
MCEVLLMQITPTHDGVPKMAHQDSDVVSWFSKHEVPDGSVDVSAHILAPLHHDKLKEFVAKEIPSCYISSEDIDAQVNKTGLTSVEIIQNKLPDKGSVMAGDFGEILTLYFLSGESAYNAKKVKKWRFKQDRTKAAPHSDVVLLYRENVDKASVNDFVICAEAKMKSTKSAHSPIAASLEGYESDKSGRLARTLVWLKEKAIDNESADSIAFTRRFTDDLLSVEFKKTFRAVAIIDRAMLDDELLKELALPPQGDEFEVIVLGISDLKKMYEDSFAKVSAVTDE